MDLLCIKRFLRLLEGFYTKIFKNLMGFPFLFIFLVLIPSQMKPDSFSISENITGKSKAGELLPGDRVPSENELIKLEATPTPGRICWSSKQKVGRKGSKGKGTFVLNRTPSHHLVRTLGSIDATRRVLGKVWKRGGAPQTSYWKKRRFNMAFPTRSTEA